MGVLSLLRQTLGGLRKGGKLSSLTIGMYRPTCISHLFLYNARTSIACILLLDTDNPSQIQTHVLHNDHIEFL